jgi:hypothetical protein
VLGCGGIDSGAGGDIEDVDFEELAAGTGHTSDNLVSDGTLTSDQYLRSEDGSHRVTLQGDGNLVLRRMVDGRAVWSSGTNGKSATRLRLQSDGNLVLRTASGAAVWSSKTAGLGATKLHLRNTGQLVLYRNSTVVWSVNGSPPAVDECPNDPNKTKPGLCGCGVPEGTCGSGDDFVTSDFVLPNPGTRAWAVTTGNQIIPHVPAYSGHGKAYFGQLHEHTRASSDGNPNAYADKAYADAKSNGMDFMALTDHGRDIDSTVEGEHNKGEWKELTTADDRANRDHTFVALSGYELTKEAQHINIFNTNWMADRFQTPGDATNDEANTRLALAFIAQDPNVIAQFNHPGGYGGGGHLNGFTYKREWDRFITLIEVSRDIDNKDPQGDLTHYYGSYTRALDKGWHVAPTSQDDNHSDKGKGTMKCRTGVIVDKLTRAHILDALKNRRVYTTNDTNLQVSFKINGQEMGSILSSPSKLSMVVNVSDPNGENGARMELISSGGKVVLSYSSSQNWTAELDPLRPYYFLRVYQRDGEGAITAPIWTGR